MQPISEILNVLKTRYSDAYVLASNGDVVVETRGRKRGKSSATILCEGEARAQAREIVGDTSDEIKGALAGLTLFFDFQRQLPEALREAAVMAEIEAEIALEEAVIEEEDAAIAAALAAGLIVPAVDEDALLNPGIAPEYANSLSALESLSFGVINHFEGQGVNTIPELIERLSSNNDHNDPPLWVCHACQALFVYSGGDEAWLARASAARGKAMANEESYRQSKAALLYPHAASQDPFREALDSIFDPSPAIEVVEAGEELDPGQFHGADGAEAAHIKAKAEMTRLTPVARFVAHGKKFFRQLDKGTAAEVAKLKDDIFELWQEGVARDAYATLRVSWERVAA